MTSSVDNILMALRKRYRTPAEAMARLGLDASLLRDKDDMPQNYVENEDDDENEIGTDDENNAAILRFLESDDVSAEDKIAYLVRVFGGEGEEDQAEEEPDEPPVTEDRRPHWGRTAMDEASKERFFERFPGARRISTEIPYGAPDRKRSIAFDSGGGMSTADEARLLRLFPNIARVLK